MKVKIIIPIYNDWQSVFKLFEEIDNLKIDKNLELERTTDRNKYLFIVGMPRCGSTLLESILSLNPEVKDLGEVFFLEESLQKTDDLLEVRNPVSYTHLTLPTMLMV